MDGSNYIKAAMKSMLCCLLDFYCSVINILNLMNHMKILTKATLIGIDQISGLF